MEDLGKAAVQLIPGSVSSRNTAQFGEKNKPLKLSSHHRGNMEDNFLDGIFSGHEIALRSNSCRNNQTSYQDAHTAKTSASSLSAFHIGLTLHPHRQTDKNDPFSLCANKHYQLETFSQPYFNRIFSICLSQQSWGPILDHDFGHLCRGGRIQKSFRFWNSQQFGSILIFCLGFSAELRQLLGNQTIWK